MRHLSQALLPLESALRARLADGYAWHKALWACFPDRRDDARDFLFRVDRLEGGFRALLLSDGRPAPHPVLAWQTKEVGAAFLGHAAYRFQLKANPTFRRSSDGMRLALYDEAKLRDWLDRKAAGGGFAVADDSLSVGAPLDEAFVKDGRRGKHVAVDFQGVLTVVDRDRFTQTFHHGIGSAKGFGYGLLMLQPLH
jgi:CRISPR system Cascade subunit CasE